MKWLSENVDLAAVVLLVLLFAASPSGPTVGLESDIANLDAINDVIAVRIQQIGELVDSQANRIIDCSAGWGE